MLTLSYLKISHTESFMVALLELHGPFLLCFGHPRCALLAVDVCRFGVTEVTLSLEFKVRDSRKSLLGWPKHFTGK